MPRQPRLDAPTTLHHVMVRGLERRAIFRDDRDRTDFVTRAASAEQGAWTVYAWALLPNHAHLLVRTGRQPLPPRWAFGYIHAPDRATIRLNWNMLFLGSLGISGATSRYGGSGEIG